MGDLLSRTALAALCAVALACGRKEPEFPAPIDISQDPPERIIRDRAALATVKANPFATQVSLEIKRVEGWLAKAEALANSNSNPKLRDLLLETAEGQIAAIQSHYAFGRAPRPPAAEEAAEGDDTSSSPNFASPSEGSP